MSGGFFDYIQFKFDDLISSLVNRVKSDKANGGIKKNETIEAVLEATHNLASLRILMHEIDWYLSGDTGEDTMLSNIERRFKDEYANAIEKYRQDLLKVPDPLNELHRAKQHGSDIVHAVSNNWASHAMCGYYLYNEYNTAPETTDADVNCDKCKLICSDIVNSWK